MDHFIMYMENTSKSVPVVTKLLYLFLVLIIAMTIFNQFEFSL